MKSKKEPYSGKSDSDFNADIENQYKNYKAGIYDKLKNKTVMNVKLKDNVFGFTWNYETGEVGEVFTEELTPKEIQLMGRVMGEDICLILEEQDIELVFGEDIETRDDLEEMGLAEVMELV